MLGAAASDTDETQALLGFELGCVGVNKTRTIAGKLSGLLRSVQIHSRCLRRRCISKRAWKGDAWSQVTAGAPLEPRHPT